jgi:hypothetical protein
MSFIRRKSIDIKKAAQNNLLQTNISSLNSTALSFNQDP